MNIEDLPWVDVSSMNENDFIINSITELLQNIPKPVILEAGMCDANDTIRLSNIKNSTVYGCEPQPDSFVVCKNKVNHLNNVNVYNIALSDVSSESQIFYKSLNINGSSSLLKDNLKSALESHNPLAGIDDNPLSSYNDIEVYVKVQTLKEFSNINNIKYFDFMWLDAEGSELNIIKGYEDMVDTTKIIYCEINFQEFRTGAVQFNDLYNYMIDKGFSINSIWGNKKWQGGCIFINDRL